MSVRRLVAEERRDLAMLLRTLSDEEWESPSLCAGWRVRDVVGHLLYDTIPPYSYLAAAVRHRSIDRANEHFVEQTRSLPTSALVDRLESIIDRGATARVMPSVALADALVHQQDIRRPLGRPRVIPAERLLQVLRRPDPLAHPRRRTRGLRLVSTDVPWSTGAGPEVRGRGEAIAMAVNGRSVALEELEGDGVAVLRERLGANT
jgi:uncharacterized protein (TIGR03083 family)